LNVTSFGNLDSGVDETFTTSHGVEEELLRSETPKIRVLDETACLGAEIVFSEMGECSMLETERYTSALYRLLTHADRSLRVVPVS